MANFSTRNSMEFMMPAQYSHFASYPSSYQSSEPPTLLRPVFLAKAEFKSTGYMEQYTNAEQQQGLAQASPQPSSYAPSYATSSPMIASSPVTSQRASSRDREQIASQHYQQVVPSPYDQSVAGAQGNYGYAPTPSPAAPIQYTAGYATYVFPFQTGNHQIPINKGVVDKTHTLQVLTAWATNKCPVATYHLRTAAMGNIMR